MQPALAGVDLQIREGEFVVLAGRSASGKSTLLRAACGLVPHFHGGEISGSVVVAGLDTNRNGPAELAGTVGYVAQDPETQVVSTTVAAELAPGVDVLELLRAHLMFVAGESPPEDVHAMARGVLSYAGDPMIADLVVHAFSTAGCDLPDTGTVLDFGCSSGRILRVLAAYRPGLTCVGCDPNAEAIAWAGEHLPMARFLTSPTVPPLDFETASVARAYAISIWSHFHADAGLAWLDEMHRVIEPGGALLLTTHGLDTLAAQLRRELMTQDSAAEAMAAMLEHGHKYFDVFGAEGDWGVKDPGWGNSYTGADWLAAKVTPRWAVRLFHPGMLDGNQDVFVLERRP